MKPETRVPHLNTGPTPGEARRRALFERGADAVAKVFPEAPRCYVCPLCVRGFPEGALDDQSLTLEHVPPGWMGGKTIVLTCRDCNNRTGHLLEAETAAQDLMLDFVTDKMAGPQPGRFGDGAGEGLNVSIYKGEAGIVVTVPPGVNNPTGESLWRARWEEMVSSGHGDGFRFTLSLERAFHNRRALVGWLKAAYLIAFASLGYRYILSQALKVVREQLRQPEQLVLRCFSLTAPTADRRERKVGVVQDPPELQSLWVQMGRHIVLLPKPYCSHDIYAFLDDKGGNALPFVGLTLLRWPTWLELRGDLS